MNRRVATPTWTHWVWMVWTKSVCHFLCGCVVSSCVIKSRLRAYRLLKVGIERGIQLRLEVGGGGEHGSQNPCLSSSRMRTSELYYTPELRENYGNDREIAP